MFNRFQQGIALAGMARFKAAIFVLMYVFSASMLYAADDFLDPEAAFKFSAKMLDAKTAEVTYAIADGYYMYREHFKFRVEGASLGEPTFPAGTVKFDETFQKNVETYHHSVSIRLPVSANGPFTLISTGQGCAEKGLCYPPMDSTIVLTSPSSATTATTVTSAGVTAAPKTVGGGGVTQPVQIAASSAPPVTAAANSAPASECAPQTDVDNGVFEAAIKGGQLLVILPLFFLGGLALSLTPCVLPMVPILSSIIVGEGGAVTRRRGFTLSVAYSLGMAIIYTVLGITAGWIGEGLAASFQNPWVLSGFALLIAILALSMFDVYQLQMPAVVQEKLMTASGKQTAGKLVGVFVMGALSGLIIGPCVAAPLVGVLVFISETHDAVLGGSALFATAAGMSVPLLLVGLSAGWLLPRAGIWMEAIKRFFGVLLLGVALWMVSPVIPIAAQMLSWAMLGIAYGMYLIRSKRGGSPSRLVGALFALFGVVQLVGAATGAQDIFEPLAYLNAKPQKELDFVRIKSIAELDEALVKAPGKTAMLDFYADWCVSCKEMEKFTFSDLHIRAKLANTLMLQADVTANNDADKALLKRFNLFGPPGIIFFNRCGQEINGGRVIGYQDASRFGASLTRIFHDNAGVTQEHRQ